MATLQVRLADLITAIGTDYKVLVARIGTLTSLTTAEKGSLVGALNEVNAKPAGGAAINDASATTATTTTYSANKINSEITSARAAVKAEIFGAATPATLDTLDEIAAAIADDANYATTMTTALGNRLRFDAAQTLTVAQKAQAKTNLDAYGSLEIGNPDTDLVALYTTAKA